MIDFLERMNRMAKDMDKYFGKSDCRCNVYPQMNAHDMDRYFGEYDYRYNAYPQINAYDYEDKIEIEVILAGVDKESLNINFENNIITIEGEKISKKQDNTRCIRQEIDYGKFKRAVKIGVAVDPNSTEATYDKGILKITLKKEEKAKPKKIEIK